MSANTNDDPPVPTPDDVSDRERFDKLVEDALANVRSSADKWRTGLAALVTLATTAVLIGGPASAADLPAANRYWGADRSTSETGNRTVDPLVSGR